jgi:site-specific DNA-methyltransferase (adenine-specific)
LIDENSINHEVDYDLAQEVEEILYEGFYHCKFNDDTLQGYINYVSEESSDFRKLNYEIKKAYLQYAFESLSEWESRFSRDLSHIADNIVCSKTLDELEEEYEPPYDPKTETVDMFHLTSGGNNTNSIFYFHSLSCIPFTYSNVTLPSPPDLNEFFISDNIRLYNNDCLDAIFYLEDQTIDLVITSPPYNVNLGKNKYNKNGYDVYNDNKEHSEYISWLKTIFWYLYSKLKKGSRVAINMGDGKNGKIPTHSDIIQFMTKIGYLPFATIIWEKGQIGNRRAWGSWLSPSSPSFPKPFEYILIFAKESYKLQTKGVTDLEKQEFIDWSLAMWKIQPENRMKKIGHPAMFPTELPYRLIKKLSWKGATVLDIFNGAGSTGVACQQLGRKYIGIELSKKYCEISMNRWKQCS